MTATKPQAQEELPRALMLAFAPLHKRAFGVAIGLATGLLVAGATLIAVIRGPLPGQNLWLLGQYFAGYEISWLGVLIGFGWGLFVGFVAGWFIAFCRNLIIAISIFLVRARAELTESRDFLDHI